MVRCETGFGVFITTRSILVPMPFFCSPFEKVLIRCNSLVGTANHSSNYAANLQRHQINSGWGSLKCKARVWFCYIHRASQNKLLSELLDLALPSPVGCLLIIAGLQRWFKQAPMLGAESSNSESNFVLGHPVLCSCDPSSILEWILCFVSSFQSFFQINNCLTRCCFRDIGFDLCIPAPPMNNQRPQWIDGGPASSFKASEIRARPGWEVLQLLLKRTGRGKSASLCGHDLPIIQTAPSAYYCSGGPSLNITAAKVFEEIMRACYIYKRERKQESRHSTIWIYNCAMG